MCLLIFRSNTPYWRSNTALDGPLINQSNCLFLSGYTIIPSHTRFYHYLLAQYSHRCLITARVHHMIFYIPFRFSSSNYSFFYSTLLDIFFSAAFLLFTFKTFLSHSPITSLHFNYVIFTSSHTCQRVKGHLRSKKSYAQTKEREKY